jgi:ATP-dependent RNA helicase SUPV3L1/SUV3
MAAEWRNARLDFQSLQGLIRSLAAPPPAPALRLSEESQDETTLRQLSTDELIIRRCRDRSNLMRLWEVCQTPDFRKTTQDEHARLIGGMFEHLTQGDRRLPEDWMHGQFASLDRVEGDIDVLSARLARVRTLAYVANRADWLADPQTWQGRARALEDRLSDTLHQSLMQRFVDRRTSALLRSLNQNAGPILGGIDPDGAVMVEGHLVGRLAGLHFEPERGASALENRALRAAVERVVAPEIARRLGELASECDGAFALKPGGVVDWRGEAAGEISGGAPFAPRVRLIGEFGAEPQRERATRRLEAFVAAETSRRLFALKQLKEAIEDGQLKGLARGLAYQLVEQSGALDRRAAETRIRMLSRNERRTLKGLGVRFGAFTLYLPSLLSLDAQLVGAAYAELARPGWRPEPRALTPLPHPAPPPEALSLRGLRAVGGLAVPIAELERLDALARAALPEGAGAVELTPALLADLKWRVEDAKHVLRGLSFIRVRKGESPPLWRRRPASAKTEPSGLAATPFAALAALAKPSHEAGRRARRGKARRRIAAGRGAP